MISARRPSIQSLAKCASRDMTFNPYQRTPQEAVAALPRDPGRPEPAAQPHPVGKDLRAALEGKAAAMSRLAQQVAQPPHSVFFRRGEEVRTVPSLTPPIARKMWGKMSSG
jgi:hypothetical protein